MNEQCWKVSSYSGNQGNCVEVKPLADGGVLVRDTKDRSVPPFRYTAAEWDAFIKGVKDGEFDL
ncbi:DUF397 domain-containing protein [Sciscionella marina]|uniref:DUF397 domain-containing protein n=1 Tax=Sciscionella marina TaxID=508770 RepID=UPI0003816AAD|nr:DUF397 domain-containing protein [Sciscionella marina]